MTNTQTITRDFRGLVAVDDAQNLTLIAITEDCRTYELFINGYAPDDNCVECRESLEVGLYEMHFETWSRRSLEGEYHWGIYATVIRQIGETPNEFRIKHRET